MLTRRLWPSRPTFENPFQDFEQLRRGMLRLLDSASQGGVQDGFTETGSGVFPPVNVSQNDDSYFVRALLPGVKASDLTISALRNRLSISGRRELPGEKERVSYHRRERAEDAWSRTVTFPTDIAADRVEARYADGILTLTLPKAEEAKPRQIQVKS
jgi:HSP20 family protein